MTVKKCLQTLITSCPLGGIIVPIENHCLRPVPSPRASLPQAPRQLHLPVMAGGERHPQICLLFHLPYSHQESVPWSVCLSVCLFFLPSPRFSPSAWWTAAIWKMALFISSSLLKLPAQFSEANTVMGNQLITWDVTFKKFCSFILLSNPYPVPTMCEVHARVQWWAHHSLVPPDGSTKWLHKAQPHQNQDCFHFINTCISRIPVAGSIVPGTVTITVSVSSCGNSNSTA